jgi:tRNA-dihydrouridine synthase
MIGRAAFGNPWIFREAAAALAGEQSPPRPTVAERADTALRQFTRACAVKGERPACLDARRHYAWYFKEQITKIETFADIIRITEGIKRELK